MARNCMNIIDKKKKKKGSVIQAESEGNLEPPQGALGGLISYCNHFNHLSLKESKSKV